jgi:hypothetical protein
MIDALNHMGLQVSRDWRALGRAPEAFSQIAEQALRSHIPVLVAAPHAWTDALCAWPNLPRQNLRGSFGEPPVTAYLRAGVQVDVYFWLSPVTAIHDHAFSGAFGVLHGTSLHTTFAFHSEQPQADAVRHGRLTRLQSELLHPGDVRPIAGVQRLIHQVAHLSHPSVSVCVRTTHDVGAPRQRAYFGSELAVVSDQHLASQPRRQLDLLGMLARAGDPATVATAVRRVDEADDLLAFWLLVRLYEQGDAGLLMQALALCRPRPWFDALLPALFQASADIARLHQQRDELGRLRHLLGTTGAPVEAVLATWRARRPAVTA